MLFCKEIIKKRIMSSTAVILVFALLMQMVPQGLVISTAAETEVFPDVSDSVNIRQETEEPSYIIYEDVDLRETNVKHFRLANGNYIAAEYPTSVHYEKNGEMVDIDNTLVYDSTTNTYSPADSPIDVAFAATAGNSASAETFTVNSTAIAHTDELVTYNSGEYSMTSSLVLGQTSSNLEVMSAAEETAVGGEAQSVETTADAEMTDEITPVSISETNLSVDNSSSDEELQGDDEFLVLNKLTSKACYDDILPNVAFEYVVMPDGVKENIILKNASALRTFRFAYNIGDLTAVQEDAQTIVMKNSDDEEIYRISAPVMNDSADETSTALTFTIISSSNGTLIAELSADDEWLDDESRVYPVTLDPYTQTKQDTGIKKSGTYYQKNARTDAPGTFHVGRCYDYEVCRSFIQFDLPDIGKGGMVVNAIYSVLQYPEIGYSSNDASASMQVNVSEITNVTWGSNRWTAFTGSSCPQYNTDVISDYTITNASKNSTQINFDVTRIAKLWYTENLTNNGLALWSNEENNYKVAQFVSGFSMYTNARPIFTVTYLNNKGLESRWTTHEHSAGTAGTGYVNDYTGNLVFISPLMSTTGNRMPSSLSLVYNGYLSGTTASDRTNVGQGWRLNVVSPHITAVTDTSLSAKFPYYYTDSDGTDHYFKPVGTSTTTFEDEEGLKLTLQIVNSTDATKYILTSDDDTKLKFTESGYVYIIEKADGTAYQRIQYSGANFLYIDDGSSRRINATYANGKLSTLTDPAGRSVSFTYTGDSLTRITYPDGTYSSFTYDSENRLASAISSDSSKIGYSYYGVGTTSAASEKNRVKIVSEYGKNGADGNKVKFEYREDNTTKFTDYTGNQDGIYEIYQFDDYGRTISVVDSIGGASSYSYTSKDSGKAQNRLIAASSTSRPVENLLLNHNFENLDDTSWDFFHDYNDVSEFYRSERYLGYYSVRLSNTNYYQSKISQYINRAVSGKLTFSAYIKTDNIVPKDDDRTNGGVALLIDFYDSAGTKLGETHSSQFINGTNDWNRYALTAEAPSGTAKARVYVLLKNATGTAYVDCTQAEFNAGAGQYNMLENSSFANGATGWSGTNLETGDAAVNGTYKVFGKANINKNIYQHVTVVRPANQCGVSVSGKAIGRSVDIKGDRLFALIISYLFSDGTKENKVVPFNPDTTGMQYTSKAVYPSSANLSKTVSFITFYAGYYQNENYVQFDDLQLIFDETGTSYTYDTNGNLINAIDNGQRNSTYNFSNANELTSATNPDNTNYTYKYGENNLKHRLLSARSTNMQLEFAFSYDEKGNVTKTEMYNNETAGVRPANAKSIYTETTYTTDGNYVASQTDDHGRTVSTNVYDSPVDGKINKGTLLQNTDGNGNITKYSYDADNDRLTETKAVDKTDDSVELAKNTYTYTDDKLTGITAGIGSDTVNYTFGYDTYGNQQNVKVGTQSLITNTYAERNGVLASSLYGNSDTVTYTYDGYDRIKTIKYNGDTDNRFEYYYNAEGKLARTVDNENGVMYTYIYDVIGRPISCSGSDGTKISYAFDNFNKSTRTQYYWDGVRKTTAFTYDSAKDNALKTTTFSNGSTLTNNIDGFGRVSYKTLNVGSNSFTHYLNFVHLSSTRTTNEVARLYYRKGTDEHLSVLDYKYDVNGNITKIYDRPFTSNLPTENDMPTVSYEYDQLNQLSHEVNGYTGETVDYTYDKRGNILSKTITKDGETNTINYTYGDSNWKDKLTAYDGKTITYDEIGNPLTYDGWTFDWQKGRQLASISNSDTTLSFKYNDSGIRTSKTVNGTETKYFLDGSTIVAQKTGDTILWFYYDGAGQLTAMQNGSDGEYYYYVYNYQGDVVALLDSSLNYVANYTYDSWGKLVSVTGTNTAIGNLNPFRYRGYYYDSETGLYYLNSRYYNPEIGRFINADGIIGANSNWATLYNLFTYCSNNSINLFDPFGLCDLKGTGKQGPCRYPPNDPRSCNYRKPNTVIGGNKKNRKSLDIKGGPKNSKQSLYDENGNLYQERWYDENGDAIRDRDYTDHGNPKQHPQVPHDHQWDHTGAKPDRSGWLPPDYNNYNFQNEAANGVVAVMIVVIGIIIFALTGVPVA